MFVFSVTTTIIEVIHCLPQLKLFGVAWNYGTFSEIVWYVGGIAGLAK